VTGVTGDSPPHNHFTAGPHCGVRVSSGRRVGGVGSCPTVCAGIIAAAGIQIVTAAAEAAPDNQLAAGPHCTLTPSGSGGVGSAGGDPSVGRWIVSAASGKTVYVGSVGSGPYNDFSAGPDCGVTPASVGHVRRRSASPSVVGAVERSGGFRGTSHPPEAGDAH